MGSLYYSTPITTTLSAFPVTSSRVYLVLEETSKNRERVREERREEPNENNKDRFFPGRRIKQPSSNGRPVPQLLLDFQTLSFSPPLPDSLFPAYSDLVNSRWNISKKLRSIRNLFLAKCHCSSDLNLSCLDSSIINDQRIFRIERQ